MNIALIGYGRMGKTIERIARDRGHAIVYINNGGILDIEQVKLADVAIEFTQPDAAAENITKLLTAGIPVVSGTTGWLEAKNMVDQVASAQEIGFVYASNFSLGVNLFFAFNEKLASMMNEYKDYQPRIHEIHHTGKKDEPSGTAITAAEGILKEYPALKRWTMDLESKGLTISAERTDPYFGTHIVSYDSSIDTIELKHEAHSRDGFALGAVIAAEWLPGKKGPHNMKDVLGL
ncbi:MAG: 4-hydroxy-tetrahydrodipicolinate reductase [Schleiferiaceae bacterium]|nr:4-hydroxy-tetrahydrodipicolinate reductase [Schleiferiaceae bacterium]MDG2110189.1 4-hydroxy-tetrahydrodipicolinate reductase [Schleiferiaceae bacterium]